LKIFKEVPQRVDEAEALNQTAEAHIPYSHRRPGDG
jgi:hypothetical protein